MTICTNCTFENIDAAKFCGKCGRVLGSIPAGDDSTVIRPSTSAGSSEQDDDRTIIKVAARHLDDEPTLKPSMKVPSVPPGPNRSGERLALEASAQYTVDSSPVKAEVGTELQVAGASLVVKETGMQLPLRPGPCMICMGSTVYPELGDIDVWQLFGLRALSRRHAFLAVDSGGKVTLFDAGSKNGTFVNGNRLEPLIGQSLKSGDTITLGRDDRATFLFQR